MQRNHKMSINFEHAAMKALEELKSMPIEELVEKVDANVNEPLSISIRELGYLNEKWFQFTETQIYSLSTGKPQYALLDEQSYKTFKATNGEQFQLVAS